MPRNFLAARSGILWTIRSFFHERHYLEVETPLRLPVIIPERHIAPIASDGCFLQTSPEQCMKRLLAAGHARIFQISRCFRSGERGSRHLPEFTMLEWYRLDCDYRSLMAECAELLRFVASRAGSSLPPAARILQSSEPWQRLTVADAFQLYAPLSLQQALISDRFDEILVDFVESRLGIATPTFLHDYPAALGSLARLQPGNAEVAERFELYVNGVELANGFSELCDPVEQEARFREERRAIREMGRDPGPWPRRFLDDLQAIDSAAGIALGVDRLVMLICGACEIDEVVAFPPERL